MDEAAFPVNEFSKLGIVTRAVERGVADLTFTRPECVFIGVIVFGGRAAFVPDRQGNPFILSVSEIKAQFGDSLGEYLFECFQSDKADVDRRYSDFMAPLTLAREIYDAALTGDLISPVNLLM